MLPKVRPGAISLHVIRKLRSLKRILDRTLPEAVVKLIAGGAKRFGLFPTVEVILFRPDHLFRILPLLRDRRRTEEEKKDKPKGLKYYASPLEFAISVAVAQVALLLLLDSRFAAEWLISATGEEISKGEWALNICFVVLNAALAILSPFILPMIGPIVGFMGLFNPWKAVRLVSGGDADSNPAIWIPLAISTYRALDWRLYAAAMLYYYLYFYFMMLLVGAAVVTVGVLTSDLIQLKTLAAIRIAVTIACCIGAWLGYLLLVRPYVRLLMSCAPAKTELMKDFLAQEQHRRSKSPKIEFA